MVWKKKSKYNKYNNKKVTFDGHTFHSMKEGNRYCELKMLQRVGEIACLELQPKFELVVEDEKICRYIADFKYIEKDGTMVVEDVKGFKTPIYKIKSKLFKALYPKLKFIET